MKLERRTVVEWSICALVMIGLNSIAQEFITTADASQQSRTTLFLDRELAEARLENLRAQAEYYRIATQLARKELAKLK